MHDAHVRTWNEWRKWIATAPLVELIEPYLTGPFSAMYGALQRRVSEVFYPLNWDDLDPEQRTEARMLYDLQQDPQWVDEFERLSVSLRPARAKRAEIAEAQKLPETPASEAEAKDLRLKRLNAELAKLEFVKDDTKKGDAGGPAPRPQNKSEKTLIFEAKVIELMGKFWDERTLGTEPNKSDLVALVYKEILRTPVRGARKTTQGMVNDAAKPWKYPIVLPTFVRESQFNEKRHPFKGDK